MKCTRERCGSERLPGERLCAVHLKDKKARQAFHRSLPDCAHSGCRQKANSVSNLCGDHWRDLLARQEQAQIEHDRQQAADDFKDRLRQRIRAAPDFEALKEVLADCVDYWIDR